MEIMFGDTPTKTVPDLMTGTDRLRKWGLVLSFSIIPEYHKNGPTNGPLIYPKLPYRLVLGDSLEELKARVHYELEKAIHLGGLSVGSGIVCECVLTGLGFPP
jgi:hypothetical protein